MLFSQGCCEDGEITFENIWQQSLNDATWKRKCFALVFIFGKLETQ